MNRAQSSRFANAPVLSRQPANLSQHILCAVADGGAMVAVKATAIARRRTASVDRPRGCWVTGRVVHGLSQIERMGAR